LTHECGRGTESRQVVGGGMVGGCALEGHMIRRCRQESLIKQVSEQSKITIPEQGRAENMLRMCVCRGLVI